MPEPSSWSSLRAWDGRADRAFEELCYQVRAAAPPNWTTIKTRAPDGGVEWYDISPNAQQVYGHQAKFTEHFATFLGLARESLRTVAGNLRARPVSRLTFYAPLDLTDPAEVTSSGRPQQGERQRWNAAVARWKSEIDGAAGIDIRFVGGGELLGQLLEPSNEGRRRFFFGESVFGRDWFERVYTRTRQEVGPRYTPESHVELPIAADLEGLALSRRFLEALAERRRQAVDAAAAVAAARPQQQAAARAVDWTALEAQLGKFSDDRGQAAWLPAGWPGDGASSRHTLPQWFEFNAGLDSALAMLATAAGMAATVTAETGLPAALATTLNQVLEIIAEVDRRLSRLHEWSGSYGRPGAPWSAGLSETAVRSLAALHEITGSLWGYVGTLGRAIQALHAVCDDPPGQAATRKAYLLDGEAGQGKTHLLLDGVRTALDDGRLALFVDAQRLRDEEPLAGIIRQLGLGAMSYEEFLGALDAAGSLTGARVLLCVDAINESERPAMWASELPSLLGWLESFPNVALAVSYRSTYQDIVLPEDAAQLLVARRTHRGFFGHEMQALERYLASIPHALPRTPLLVPDFSNPLFVKLFAAGYADLAPGEPIPLVGSDRTAVFGAFLRGRIGRINRLLGLDPAERAVDHAVDALATRMAWAGREVLPRVEAVALVQSFAPHLAAWPNTLLGQLLAEGVLVADRAVFTDGEVTEGVSFPYQAVTDHLVANAALMLYGQETTSLSPTRPLAPDASLRVWLEAASHGLLLAAGILLAERHGVELVDALGLAKPVPGVEVRRPGLRRRGDDDPAERRAELRWQLLRQLPDSVPLRAPGAVTQRTVELLNIAIRDVDVHTEAWQAVLSVACEPEHPLNADRLHEQLSGLRMPARDAWWGGLTYSAVDEVGPVLRLLRWAEQLPTPAVVRGEFAPAVGFGADAAGGTPEEAVARLASIVLGWLTASPNRFLRDRATKALVQLFLAHPQLPATLFATFATVDDRYVTERVLLAGYGFCLRAGHAARWDQAYADGVQRLARIVLARVFGDGGLCRLAPDLLVCDTAAGIVAYAAWRGLASEADVAAATPPYRSRRPGNPPSRGTLEARYPRSAKRGEGYGTLHFSILGSFADFGRYIVDSTVEKITLVALSKPAPASRQKRQRQERISRKGVQRFIESLDPAFQDELLAEGMAGLRQAILYPSTLHGRLTQEQERLLERCMVRPKPISMIAGEWARRWIFQRVIGLGWTPQKFAGFDETHRYHDSSGVHKAERFGKKYSWLALHELLARLVDHYHLAWRGDDDPRPVYVGAFQLGRRDLDPSLPPAPHPLDIDEDPLGGEQQRQRAQETYPPDDENAFWQPRAPRLPPPEEADVWVASVEELSDLADLIVRVDRDGTRWVTLSSAITVDGPGLEGTLPQATPNGSARQWHHLYGWLVRQEQTPTLVGYLDRHSLMPQWMPEGWDTHEQVYLGELPWAPAARYWDNTRGEISERLVTVLQDQARNEQTDKIVGRDASACSNEKIGASVQRANDAADTFNTERPDGWTVVGRLRHEDIAVIPAWQQYGWSGTGRDCSLDADVRLRLPATLLLGIEGEVVLHPDRPDVLLLGQDGATVIATCRHRGENIALLVREDWLQARLAMLGVDLVIGLLGQRRILDELPRRWRVLDQVAVLTGLGWQVYPMRTRLKGGHS